MAGEDVADVFAAPQFFRPPQWLDAEDPNHPPEEGFFHLDIAQAHKRPSCLENDSHVSGSDVGADADTDADTHAEADGFFKLPKGLVPTSLLGLGGPSQLPALPPVDPPKDGHETEFADWVTGEEQTHDGPEIYSWDAFAMPDIPPTTPLFVTEAGASAYDAVLQWPEDPLKSKSSKHPVLESNPYKNALISLALGRASVFFTWDEAKRSFAPELEKMRISGYSTQALQGLQDNCVTCGNTLRFLARFAQGTFNTLPSPGRVALAKALDTLLLVVQSKLGSQARQIKSLLQLQSSILPVHEILTYFKVLVSKLKKSPTDEHMLSVLFEECQALEHGDDLLSGVMCEILSRVSEPWCHFAEQWIGLRSEEGNPITKDGLGKSFVKVENMILRDDFGVEVDEPDFFIDEERMPSFVPEEVGKTMFETGRNLRLLRTHHPDHAIGDVELVTSHHPPDLKWRFTWDSIMRYQAEASEYETASRRSLGRSSSKSRGQRVDSYQRNSSGFELQLFGQDGSQLAERLAQSIKELNKPLPAVTDTDRLAQLLHERLFVDRSKMDESGVLLTPHWSLLPLLSLGPLVEAQARLVNQEYMKLLFDAHKLRDHISIQKEFQLLGNGLFCSQLSHALFDPSLATAERQVGVALGAGVMGLRLGSRNTWPPASSELRLALMGILAESSSHYHKTGSSTKQERDLPGDLSFAVRNLPEEEIQRCLDPGSLEALDFLRLSYKTPPPLAPVITPSILIKYDRIFKLLLRMLRMLYVVSELFRDVNARTSHWENIDNASLRFCNEAHRFVSSVATYFFETGIGSIWCQFELWLNKVYSDIGRISGKGPTAVQTQVVGPDALRARHEQTLDRILHALLLRKRQKPVRELLEGIFTSILKFSKVAGDAAVGRRKTDIGEEGEERRRADTVREMYKGFQKKVDVFITVCKGLSEKGGGSGGDTKNSGARRAAGSEENMMENLLVKLEWSGRYGGTKIYV